MWCKVTFPQNEMYLTQKNRRGQDEELGQSRAQRGWLGHLVRTLPGASLGEVIGHSQAGVGLLAGYTVGIGTVSPTA